MTDEFFIEKILQRGREAKDKVSSAFSNITAEQLNWKPSPKGWSIAQCLDHLVISDSSYFSNLEKITKGTYQMSFWEKYSPFTHTCGQILKDRLQEQARKKMTAPKKLRPASNEAELEFIKYYQTNLDSFLGYISNCRKVDIDKTIITSPTIPIVTYSLRDAFQFLIQHEHRHINQAMEVKLDKNFSEKINTQPIT